MNKKKDLNKEKNANKVIFIIIGITILCILGSFIYIFFFAHFNEQTIIIKNNQIEDFTIDDLKFTTENSTDQLNVVMTNTSEKDIDIKTIVIKITDKENTVDSIELEYDQVLKANHNTSFNLGYDIDEIDKISFQVIYNE